MEMERFKHPLKDTTVFSFEFTGSELAAFSHGLRNPDESDISDCLMLLAVIAKRIAEAQLVVEGEAYEAPEVPLPQGREMPLLPRADQ